MGKRFLPHPGSAEEAMAFAEIQKGFAKQFSELFPAYTSEKTIVIIPSLTLDHEILSKISGHIYYEERLLCLLMLLRMPSTKIIYISSMPINAVIIDYYLHLLPGITAYHARQRLLLLSCYDASAQSLTKKILDRPRLIQRIKNNIADVAAAHLVCFNVTAFEKTLSVQLNIPVYGTDPALNYFGTKSGSRKLFRECGITMPEGVEDLHSKAELCKALAKLKQENPALRKAVIKLNDGFSGDGNAIYYYHSAYAAPTEKEIADTLGAQIKIVATDLSEKEFFKKFSRMGGIAEEFIEGSIKASPSVQCRINPLRQIEIISTHDQVLGGADEQVFVGAYFPANEAYNTALAVQAERISAALAVQNILGRFSIDFISVFKDDTWKHYAIEINLRKGGTTHPYLMLEFLTNGRYIANEGRYLTASCNERFYFASDNVYSEMYKGLTPHDLIEIAMYHGLLYDASTQEGVMFHLIGALSEFGKIGVVCIAASRERARQFYEKVIEVLDKECNA